MNRRVALIKQNLRIVVAWLLGLVVVLAGPEAATAGAAGEDKPSALVAEDRAKWPAFDGTPRPDDGANLALSVAKWEGRAGIPGKESLRGAMGDNGMVLPGG
jgi:hypothetical protein